MIAGFFSEFSITSPSEIIIATHDEYMLDVAASLRAHFKIDGAQPEAIEKFRNKVVSKRILSNAGINTPRHMLFNKPAFQKNESKYCDFILNQLGDNLFAKPLDGARCRSISHINGKEQLSNWLALHQHDSLEYEIEEFISGALYNCTCILRNEILLYSGIFQFAYPCFDFLNSKKPLAGMTIPETHEDFNRLKTFAAKTLLALDIPQDCVAHVEIFKTLDGDLYFLEAAARPPGGVLSDILFKYSGIQVEEQHYRLQLKLSPVVLPSYAQHQAWIWFPKPEGIVSSLNTPSSSCDIQFEWLVFRGEKYDGPRYLGDRSVSIFLSDNNFEKLTKEFYRICNEFNPCYCEGGLIISNNPNTIDDDAIIVITNADSSETQSLLPKKKGRKEQPRQILSRRKALKNLTALTLPFSASRVISMAGNFTGILMLSRIDQQTLAATSLISAAQTTLVSSGSSILYSTGIFIGEAFAKNVPSEISKIVFQSNLVSALISVPTATLCFFSADILNLLGQPENLSSIA
jgi:hypothetical protein